MTAVCDQGVKLLDVTHPGLGIHADHASAVREVAVVVGASTRRNMLHQATREEPQGSSVNVKWFPSLHQDRRRNLSHRCSFLVYVAGSI